MKRPFYPTHLLPVLFGLSLAAYLITPFWFPLLPHIERLPLPDIRTFTPSLASGLLYGLWLLLLYGLYGLAALHVKRLPQPPGLTWLLATAAFLGIPQLFAFPINATDLYRYFIRGRIFSIHGENPFITTAASLPHDPFGRFAGEWATATTPYGPLWELVAAGITAVAQDNLAAGLLTFKLLGLLFFLANGALIWLLLAEAGPHRQASTTLLWLWNPALFNIFVIDGHNDGLMLFWLLLGYLVWQRGQQPALSWSLWPLPAFLLLVLAPLSKPIGLLALPFFWLSMGRSLTAVSDNPWPARLRFALLSVAGSLLLVWLSFLPFGSPLDLARRLLDEASGGGFSPLTLLFLLLQQIEPAIRVAPFLQGAQLLFLGLLLFWLWQTWWGERPSIRSVADIFTAYLWQAFSFRLWYAVWAFPWLLLDHRPYWRHVGFWFLLTSQLSVLIYGHVRVYALGGSIFWSHLLGVPFTFGLPFWLAWQSGKVAVGQDSEVAG